MCMNSIPVVNIPNFEQNVEIHNVLVTPVVLSDNEVVNAVYN